MAKKSGQARVPNKKQWERLYQEITKHRHPEKNRAIMQVSQKLGLRVQEIALLELKEVCKLTGTPGTENRSFKIFEIMPLPASYTKGANANNDSAKAYQRRKVSFSVEEFDKVVNQISKLAQAGVTVNPEDFYPPTVKHKGVSRDLPMVNQELREALAEHIQLRLNKNPYLKPSDPLFVTQKGGPYSPNTLQEHMALMLREWAGIEKASSHSGRRSLITNVIHEQKKSLKIAQTIAGHKAPSTTVIYEQPPEKEVSEVLKNVGKTE